MAKYIDKDVLAAKIEKRFDDYTISILKHYDVCKEAKASELGKILTILNTLEAKEVDLEKEVELWMEANEDDAGHFSTLGFAKYFFELGLKTQKGDMSLKYYPKEFSSYEEYVKYLKEKGLALDVP
jgi:hypothetical protein